MDQLAFSKLPVLASFAHSDLTISITLENNLLCSIIQPQFQQDYTMAHLKMLKSYDIDTIYRRIVEEVEISIKGKYEYERNVIIVLTTHQSDLIKSMMNSGLKVYTQIFAMKNINTKVDVLFLQMPSSVDRSFSIQYIRELLKSNVPAVLHGSEIIFKSDQKVKEVEVKTEVHNGYTIITGGSRGIGRCIAQCMAKQGRNIIITGRPGNKEIAEYAIYLSQTYNIQAEALYLNIRDDQNLSQLAERVKKMNVDIQCVVFNAGVGTKTSHEQATQVISAEQILLQVNSIGPLKLFCSLQSAGVIKKETLLFMISSVGSLRGFTEFNPVDICSKYVPEAWMEKLLKQSYKMMTIYPGATDTDMFQKSTLNYAKEKNKLEEFVQNLPKGVVIKPEDIGYIVSLFSRRKYKDYLIGARIPACCGLHLDYKPLPNI